MWVDQGSGFCNSSSKQSLKSNDIKIYSTYNEGKSVVAERFINTLKNKIYKHMTPVKNVCFDVLDDIGTQNYLIFQPVVKYFKRIVGVGNGEYIYFWKSKGLFDERINSITASNYSSAPELSYYGSIKSKI